MPTIYDIAKQVGVSPTTVSRVLNNYPDVSAKTRERVLATIEELNYIPSTAARSLSTKKSYLVGIVFSETLNMGVEHPFFAGVIEGFKQRLASEGYDTMFITGKLGERNIGYLQHCRLREVDGVYVVVNVDDEKLFELLDSEIHCVTTDLPYNQVPRVASDNEEGSKLVIQHFLNKGHHRILNITGPSDAICSLERFNGVKMAYKDAHKVLEACDVVEAEDFCIEAGYKVMNQILSSCTKDNRPTAVYAAGDTLAIGAVRCIEDFGLSVPHDIEVIGFDDIELASHVTPSLSTVAQDRREIGRVVASTLLELINEPYHHSVGRLTKIPVQLKLRQTTKGV